MKSEIKNLYIEDEYKNDLKNPYHAYLSALEDVFDLKIIDSFCDVGTRVGNLLYFAKKKYPKIEITGYIYVKTDAKVCYERIKKRSRTGEEEIPLDYLELLEGNHDKWLTNRPIQNEDVEWFSLKKNFITPVIVINGNIDYYDINERTKQKESIIKFVNYEITQ